MKSDTTDATEVQNDDPHRFQPCVECGEPVDSHESGNWKAPNDEQWWHEGCYDPFDRVEEIAAKLRDMEKTFRCPKAVQKVMRESADRLEKAARRARLEREQR